MLPRIAFNMLSAVIICLSVPHPCLAENTVNQLVKHAAEMPAKYTVAVVPQLPAQITHKNWGPLLHQISKATNLSLELKLYDNFLDFEVAIKNGDPDFVYMNPYHQVMAKMIQGYIPLIRDDSTKLVGIIVVRKDSPITSIKHLEGKRIAFPSPIAFGASLYMRALLSEQESLNFSQQYVSTHTNVYRNVILGMVDAGGGVNKTINAERPEVTSQLRVLYQTPGVASHPFSVHPRVPHSVREKITQTWFKFAQQDSGKEILNAVHFKKSVKANFEQDYKPLDKLRLEKYVPQN